MKFSKDQILSEIRRTAQENEGAPLGTARFFAETGIKESDWHGRFWARWGDALAEAGLARNKLNEALPEEEVLEKLAALVLEIGRFPTRGEIKMRRNEDPTFPSWNVFPRRFGTRAELAARLIAHCKGREGLTSIATICSPVATGARKREPRLEASGSAFTGHVYLLRSGRYYKIGRSNSVGRRERELAIQLPEPANVVHSIKTDDPEGIEAYWHRRFAEKRKGGEWFDLAADDVASFKRRKFM
jgi:hypothetical protein